MDESFRKKEDIKKRKFVDDIEQDEKIIKQLKIMQEEFIREEEKKGNMGVRKKVPKIDSKFFSPTKEALLGNYDRKRSKSRSKSPDRENYQS